MGRKNSKVRTKNLSRAAQRSGVRRPKPKRRKGGSY